MVVLSDFSKLEGQVDEVCNESLPGLIDGGSSLDLLIFFHFLNDEIEQDAILKHSCIEWGVFSLSECDFEDLDDFVMEQVVERVLAEEGNEDGEEGIGLSDYILSVKDVLLQDEPQDLDNFDTTSTQFGSAAGSHCQFLTALLHEMFEQLLELGNNDFVFRQDERHAGEVCE